MEDFGCALLQKKFKEDLFTSCIEHGILQDSSEPSNDNPNVVNALREPFIVNQDLEEFVSENSNADIKSFSPSPIPVKDSDSFMEEIDLTFTLNEPMPSGLKEDDYDSERDMLIREELLDIYSLSLPVIESYHFDIPSFSYLPAKPPDGNTGILNIKMMGDISDQKALMITRDSNQEKSPDLLSHRGFETFQPFTECLMMIHGKNIPILDVPFFHFYPLDQFKYGENWVKLSDLKQALHGSLSSIPGNLKTLAKGFYPPSLHFLSFSWESCWSISNTFRFSVGLQTPDDLSRSRLGFIEKIGVHG
uniref:Uncharacterized protein n=1 Tax=Tanacetum cinerariifolium TaxID=118510 RepID=A0A6L2M6X6_TANCI|nr:hypothetical protein [Tanacetum cinerariifolium]